MQVPPTVHDWGYLGVSRWLESALRGPPEGWLAPLDQTFSVLGLCEGRLAS